MSLQVWLPFTDGTLKQQGLSNATATSTGAVTLNNTGKLGKCATFGTATGRITLPASTMTSFTECSVAFWINISAWQTNWDTFFQAGLGGSPWNNYTFGILRNQGSYLAFCISDNSSATNGNCQTSNLDLNTWYHVAFTYKTGHMCTYVNGNLFQDYSTSIIPKFNSITHISIGQLGNATSYQTSCKMNDFRIYNHCLSSMEVKQLAQGLILHQTLADPYIEGTTNIDPYKSPNATFSITNGTVTRGNFFDYDCWKIVINKTSTSSTYHYLNSNPITQGAAVGDTVTRSCWMYVPSGQTLPNHFTNSIEGSSTNQKYVQYDYTKPNTWQKISLTGTPTSSTGTNNYLFYFGATNVPFNITFYIRDIQLEIKDHDTPYVLDTRLPGIMYDCSGYCNNGELHDTSIVMSDSIKYERCIKNDQPYDSSNYLAGFPLELDDIEQITIAFWAKPTLRGKQDSGMFSTSSSLTPGSADYYLTVANQYDSGIACCNVSGTKITVGTAQQFTLDEWHHYVFTYDGTKAYFYKDGVLGDSKALTGKLKPIKSIFPFTSYAGGVWRTTSGYLSDFRVYVTGLSSTDIKSLYQNSAYIDSSGNVYGAVHSEV